MSLVATTPAQASSRPDFHEGLARVLASPWVAVALVCAGVASQAFSHLNGDNSWLINVAERTMDGGRPYVDFIESNPPVAFLVYTPAIMLARLFHLRVEPCAAAFMFLLSAVSVWMAGRALAQAGLLTRAERGFLLNAAIFVSATLPGFSFAEREHFAFQLILPWLAVVAARAARARVAWPDALIAGVAAGLALAIKPHFALGLAPPLVYLIAVRRSLVPALALEQLTTGACVLANAAMIYALFPAYFIIAPSIFDVYLLLREPLPYLATETWLLFNVALLGALAIGFWLECLKPRVAVPALSSLGFIASYFVQGKGWANHGLPGDQLAFIAVAMALAGTLYSGPAARAFR